MLMRKIFFLCLIACVAMTARAQAFDHLAVGIGAGTDGVSLELAAPLGSHVDLRAGYGLATGVVGYTFNGVSVPEHPGLKDSRHVGVPLKINLGMSDARLLFNIYPSATKGFHFTIGAFLGSPCFARGTLTEMPSDYNTVGFEVDGYLVRAQGGKLATELRAPGLGGASFAVKPYVGIGFGRAVNRDGRVSFCFDLGAQYQGKAGLWAEGENLTGRTQMVQLTRDQVEDIGEVVDEIGKYTAFWPTLSLRLYVRLF